MPLWWMTALFALTMAAVFTFIKVFVIDRGVGSAGGFLTTYTAIAILLRILWGNLPDRVLTDEDSSQTRYQVMLFLEFGHLLF